MQAWNRVPNAVVGGMCLVATALFAQAVTAPYSLDRYELIMTRKPFGAEQIISKDGPVASPAAQAAEAAINALKLSALVEDDQGRVTAGIVDSKTSASYMLRMGDSEGGIEMLETDYLGEKVKVRREGIERWLSMNGEAGLGGGGDASPTKTAMAMASPIPGQRVVPPRFSRPVSTPAAKGLTKAEYAKIRETLPPPTSALHQRFMAKNPNFKPLEGEALDKHLQSYNMELIRAGGELGPALPIPLTPEQDAQLVKEGVLPPNEGSGE